MQSLLLDSGAFSAFTQKKEVDIKAYCDFILANSKYVEQAVNLDVINPQSPEAAAEAGMENFHYMLDRGIPAMPVFHARESLKWLDEMLDLTDYIGLSGTSLVSPVEDKSWHKIVWQYVTDAEGYPIAKFHSFGNTSEYMLLTMPFYSADSATWMIQAGRAARVKLQGKSYQLHTRKIGDTNFILDSDTGPKRESWEKEITDLGINPRALMDFKGHGSQLAMLRSYLVASSLLQLQEKTRNVTKFDCPTSLIVKKSQLTGGFKHTNPVRVFFVISPSAYYFNFPILRALNITNILVSYFYVVTASKNFWEERMIPFLTDPDEFFKRDEHAGKFLDLLNSVLIKPVELTNV